MQEEATPTQKFGFIDIKQPPKVKGRKLKSWRRRWAVLTLLNDLSRGGQPLAKLDLYESETKWRRDSPERVTFVLENITSVQPTASKTHAHAIEIVERQAMLMLSGLSEVDSYGWMLALQQMLVPSQVEINKDSYQVAVLPNAHSVRCGLAGEYTMHVNPRGIELINMTGMSAINWGLSTLIRFQMEGVSTLCIECGPNSPTGQSSFRLSCNEASAALRAIRQSICQALFQKQHVRHHHQQQQQQHQQPQQQPATPPQVQHQHEPQHHQQQPQQPLPQASGAGTPENSSRRTRSISATVSEKGYQSLLESLPLNVKFDRSDSDSSGASSTHHQAPLVSVPLTPVSPLSPQLDGTAGAFGQAACSPAGGVGDLLCLEDGDVTGCGEFSNSPTLARNNSSHSSVDSQSPVILRAKTNQVDVAQHIMSLHPSVASTGTVLSGSPTGSAGSEGSPITRNKRSSENIRMSTPELEVVHEKDENGSMGGNVSDIMTPTVTHGAPKVTFNIGDVTSTSLCDSQALNSEVTKTVYSDVQSEVLLFDDLIPPPPGRHRRYSSLPNNNDSGYSVIKDININSTTDTKESTVRERAVSMNDDIIKPLAPSVPPPNRNSLERPVLQASEDSKVEGQYQEIDKKENPYSTIGGRYGRRRSSSMSDLSVWMYGSKKPYFENVYEDVDGLKEAVHKLSRLHQKEEPPELPARPLSLSFSVPLQKGGSLRSKPRASTLGLANKSLKKKRSLFGKNKSSSLQESECNELDVHSPTKSCTCKDSSIDKQWSVALSGTQCPDCGRPVSQSRPSHSRASSIRSALHSSVSSSTEELISTSGSSISEVYADITELQGVNGKRRRSSDITPVTPAQLDRDNYLVPLSASTPKNDRHKTSPTPPASSPGRATLPAGLDRDKPPALPQRKHSPPSKPHPKNMEDLIQLVDSVDISDKSTASTAPEPNITSNPTAPSKALGQQPPPASDPLISFFLDDDLFQTNPMVTGTLPVYRPTVLPGAFPSINKSLQSPSNLNTISFPSPFSKSMNALHLQSLAVSDLNNLNKSGTSSSSAFNALHHTPGFLGTINNNPVPMNFVNPFSQDMFTWNHVETALNGQLQNQGHAIRESNYLAMSTKQELGHANRNNFLLPQSVADENIYMAPTEK
ncbi:docking protein 2 [Plakobranchus ocellatus]|uniref:Docking protein 2 n=1 Tax=Plakobranchus ocellatus TaxID=259542 RepID=A0AAV3ZNK2_9GAST|nr:docking protein 2 [Plakobranchus ocellatus]